MGSPRTATELATAAGEGDLHAADELFRALYAELHSLAERMLLRQSPGHTLQPTALVHEAYIKLIDPNRIHPIGTAHFRALAARAMNQILIDHARGKRRQKRGGPGGEGADWRRVELDDVSDPGAADARLNADLLTLHETLMNMKRLDERLAQVVELRLLGGLSTSETADVLGISARSVEREWALGKAWLRRELSGDSEPER